MTEEKYREYITEWVTEPHLYAAVFSIHWLDRVLFICCVALMVIVLTGNTLILLAMWRKMFFNFPNNILLTNMAISDLGVGVMVMPFTAESFFQLRENNTLSEKGALCTIVGVIRQSLLCSSTFTVAVISFERYVAVLKPMSYKRLINMRFALVALSAIWIYSLAYSLITVAMTEKNGAYVYNDYTGYCIQQWWFIQRSDLAETLDVMINIAVNFLIPFTFMGFYYIKVLRALHFHRNFCKKSENSSSFSSKNILTKRDKEINVSWTVLIILVLFVLCWIPFLVQCVLAIIHQYEMDDQLQLYFVTAANMFYFLGCGINPLILIFRCAWFKSETKIMLVTVINWILRTNFSVVEAH